MDTNTNTFGAKKDQPKRKHLRSGAKNLNGHGIRLEEHMSLIEAIRSQLTASMKERKEVQKGILRVILGDLSTLESRSGKKATDEEVKHVVKRLLEGNLETLKYVQQPKDSFSIGVFEKLTEENVILTSLLPKTLSKEEIREKLDALMPVSSTMVIYDIDNAKSDGQATGIAMKYFKTLGLEVDGSDVAAVVKEFRSWLKSLV